MKSPRKKAKASSPVPLVWDLLTLDKLMTGPLVHLVYWAGLGVIALAGFGMIGSSVGFALREGEVVGWLLALPVLVTGLLVIGALALLWRTFCEFYVVIVHIGDDLRALRKVAEAESGAAPPKV